MNIFYAFLTSPMGATRSVHLILLDFFCEGYNLQSSSLFSLLHQPATYFLLGANNLLTSIP